MAKWLLGGAIALYFLWGVAGALRTGIANQAGTRVCRRKAPFHFWALIVGWSAVAALILVWLPASNI
jgi:hypothetical protein